jgi:hypothetical protein
LTQWKGDTAEGPGRLDKRDHRVGNGTVRYRITGGGDDNELEDDTRRPGPGGGGHTKTRTRRRRHRTRRRTTRGPGQGGADTGPGGGRYTKRTRTRRRRHRTRRTTHEEDEDGTRRPGGDDTRGPGQGGADTTRTPETRRRDECRPGQAR